MSDSSAQSPGTKPSLSYASSGVDIEAGNEAVRRIRKLVSSTRRPEQIDELGGFAGMMGLPAGLNEPVLVSCTDGVGTKLLVAIAMNQHRTVGIDLVAMNVNDLLCTGGQTLFVLDYIATGVLAPGHVEAIVEGVVEGCKQSGAALLGGETAELPGMYAEGHYDLAATAVGVVERAKVIGPQRVQKGDVVLALPSSGLHSNGYSLARKALLDPEHAALSFSDPMPGQTDQSVGECLLTPTRIYEAAFAQLRTLEGSPLHAAAHITGGGLIENPPRALPEDLAFELDLGKIPSLPVFDAIRSQGVSKEEMLKTFNCGVGMLLVVDPSRSDEVQTLLANSGQQSIPMGRVIERSSPSQPLHLI